MEKLRKALDERLEKSRYLKRTGSPGHYKYTYKEGGEQRQKTRRQNEAQKRIMSEDKGKKKITPAGSKASIKNINFAAKKIAQQYDGEVEGKKTETDKAIIYYGTDSSGNYAEWSVSKTTGDFDYIGDGE